MSDVLLYGWYGKRNTGDDAFCVVGATRYSRSCPRRSVRIWARASGLIPLPAHASWTGAYKERVRGALRLNEAVELLRARNVVHLGGSVFDHWTKGLHRHALAASTKYVSVHAQSVSIGPFAGPADGAAVAEELTRFTTVSVRDRASYNRAIELGLSNVRRSFDVAVLLPEVVGVAEKSMEQFLQRAAAGYPSGPTVGVALCDPVASRGEDVVVGAAREARITHLLRSIVNAFQDARFVFMCFGADDRAVSHRVAAQTGHARHRVVEYTPETGHMLRVMSDCDVVIAMRLHAAIFSYAAGVPFSLVAYHPKCDDFHVDVGADARLCYPASGPTGDDADFLVTCLKEPSALYRPPTLTSLRARALARESFEHVMAHIV